MPSKPKRPCSEPGCRALVDGRYCGAHARAERKRVDVQRGTAASRGYDSRWQKVRRSFLASHPLCADPFGVHGASPVAAQQVDHITPHKGDQQLFWDRTNWQPLCTSCGGRKSAVERGGRAERRLPTSRGGAA